MQRPLLHTLSTSLDNATNPSHLRCLHAQLITSGLQQSSFAVGNFVARCAALGDMSHARQAFDQMRSPNSFVWNTLLRGLQKNRSPHDALLLFDQMRACNLSPDHFTFPPLLKACAASQNIRKGQAAHALLLKTRLDSDAFVASSLVEFYLVCAGTKCARRVFDEIPAKDVVSWTVILLGYVNESGDMGGARVLFDQMPVKDLVAWNTMIGGYVRIGEMSAAKELFDRVPVKDLLMHNTMLGGYGKSGDIERMMVLFDEMRERDVVSWNSVISGLVQGKRVNDAMKVFHRMQRENIRPNDVTVISVLLGCAQVGALEIGRWVHSYIKRNWIGLDAVVGTALVDMYSKCGDLESAQEVFGQTLNKDVMAWNAMVMGFSMNGQSKNALKFFQHMQEGGIKPNEVTMMGVFCACTHAGLVEEGRKYFDSMEKDLGIAPKVEHYGCMVDLLGRAGLLQEAYELIQHMPIEAHMGVWGALLCACKIHGNVDIAESAIKHLMELDVEDGGYLAIMSNIYANAGRWNDVSKVRNLMEKIGIDKMRGCSSIVVNGEVHEFGAGEKIHPQSKEIYAMIGEISRQLRIAGHIASTSEVFFDIEEEEKEYALYFHSEKLAIAFGLISTDKRCTIRIVKNLRICKDCHSSIKLISRIFERKIVVRDRSRFHHFSDGSCSCGDYW